MNKFNILLLFFFTLTACSPKVTLDSSAGYYNYQASVVEVGAQGSVIIKSWGSATKINEAKEEAKRNAVHTLLFKGFQSTQNVNSTDLRPLITEVNAEEKYKDYFTNFFKTNGNYARFVNFTDGIGSIALGDKIKTGNRYKIAVTVSVNRSLLIKELEAAGIKKKFGIN